MTTTLIPPFDDATVTAVATSLSPDATKLALPQPSSVVVVDLTDGSHVSYPVPGRYLKFATWLSDSRVVVANEMRATGWEVDLDGGEVIESRFGPDTPRAPDGQLLTWDVGEGLGASHMRWDDGTDVTTDYNNTANPHPVPPLVGDDIIVGHHATLRSGLGLPMLQNAVVVLDRRTGNPVAYLPTGRTRGDNTTLLGWQDDRIVLGLFPQYGADTGQAVVAAWDWRTKTLEPLVTVTGSHVAWGRGW